jgi:PAS domain S-box-containing protein
VSSPGAIRAAASERFQRVFEDGPLAMALVGEDFRLTEVNAAFCRLTGYSAAELATRTFSDITHPDDRDTDLRLARKAFAGEVPAYSIDKRYVRKTGETVWVALTVSVIRDEYGAVLKGMAIVQDVTDHRRALAEAQSELEALARDRDRILEFAGEGIYHVDERGRITFVNPAAAELLGWSVAELVGKPAHELFHHTRPDGSSLPRDECPIHGPGAGPSDKVGHAGVFWRRDGRPIDIQYRRAPMRGEGARGTVVVFSDQSEQVRMERALLDARERAARYRLQAAEAERARWARELHDETLQGLAALHVLLSSAARASDPALMLERIQQAEEQIESEMEKLRGLISELRPAALDELGLAASVQDLAERTEAVYGIDVETRLELRGPDGMGLRLDPDVETTAYRVVQECLSNAARHGGASKVVVELARDQDEIRVSVADDGRGFDVSRDSSGFGLRGMRERVDLIDGRLVISSSAGAGTEVTARLPQAGGSSEGSTSPRSST